MTDDLLRVSGDGDYWRRDYTIDTACLCKYNMDNIAEGGLLAHL